MSVTKYKMTKRDFETLLYGINGGVPVEHGVHVERDGVSVKCHLYYGRLVNSYGHHEHIGTWINRGFNGCWTFDEPVNRLLRDNPEFVKREDAR